MPADIHALEVEFAKNPSLEACIPLCEAYIEQKRFMEAMVVCKKGIKGSPQDPRGRAMLARVYLEQGKLPKAQQEITLAAQELGAQPRILEVQGQIALQQGQTPEAVALLQQALAADPTLTNARALLTKLGAPAPAPQVPQAPMAPPGQAPTAPAAQPALPPRVPPQMPGMPMPGVASPAMPPPQVLPPAQPAAAPFPPSMAAGGAPPQVPPGVGALATGAESPPPGGGNSLESVNDFFAPDALGFTTEGSVETAGPGRLTIIGFVPKSTGSVKTTFFVLLGLFALGAAFIGYQLWSSQNIREINKLFTEIRLAIDEDKYIRYRDALKLGNDIREIDSGHELTLGAMAYCEAILAVEHDEEGAVARAKTLLGELGGELNTFSAPAQALVAYSEGKLDDGLAALAKFKERGSTAMVELEAFRLLNAKDPLSKETDIQLRRLKQSITSETRAYNFLGWYYYGLDDWAQADKYFTQAFQKTKGHPQALLGQVLTDLDRGIGLKERQIEIEKSIKQVFALPKDELSEPVLALAHFARGRLEQWQGKDDEAKADFNKAFELDPDNAMFNYRRGAASLQLGDYGAAIEDLRKAAQKAPNDPRLYKKLAEAQMKNRDFAGAKAALERASQLAAKDYETTLLLGDLLRSESKYDDAVDEYERVAKDSGSRAYSLAQIGISTALREANKKPQAIKHMKDYLANAPADVDPETTAMLWCELGLNAEAARDSAQAMEYFQTGIDQYRFYPDCHYYMCRTLGRGPEAKEACKLYLQLAPRGRFARDAERRSN